MSADTTLMTNPLLFGHASGPDDIEVSSITVEIAQYFLEPHTAEEAVTAGFEPDEVEMARKVGLVVPTDSSSYLAARLWEDRGWSRAAFLMQSSVDVEPAIPDHRRQPDPWRPAALGQVFLPSVDITAPDSLDALVRRRTRRSFADQPLDLDRFSEVLLRVASSRSWLHVFVVVQHVDGLDRGVYRYEPADHRLDHVRADADDADILAAVNFQPWVGGSGACAFLVVHWDLYSSQHPGSRAYIDVLIQVGELAQALLHAVYHVGAGAWGTPALHETASRNLLGIERPGIDALYAIKFGPVPAGETAG
jgi:Nitroreductase family